MPQPLPHLYFPLSNVWFGRKSNPIVFTWAKIPVQKKQSPTLTAIFYLHASQTYASASRHCRWCTSIRIEKSWSKCHQVPGGYFHAGYRGVGKTRKTDYDKWKFFLYCQCACNNTAIWKMDPLYSSWVFEQVRQGEEFEAEFDLY